MTSRRNRSNGSRGKRGGRAARSQTHRDSRNLRDELARELWGIVVRAAGALGARLDESMRALLPRLPPRAVIARQLLEDADALGRIHTRWKRQSGYFDVDGQPKSIAATGPAPSFEALCADCDVHERHERLLKLACDFRMCKSTGKGRLKHLSEIILFTGNPTLMFARAVVNVERFLNTSVYNARRGRKVSDSLADRTAFVELSPAEFALFKEPMRALLHDFIESSDRRLLAGVARDTEPVHARERRACGVTAFLFRD